MGLVDHICADIEETLSDLSGKFGFALVVWLDDRPGDAKAVCVAAPPRVQHQVQEALATGIQVLGES